MAANINVADVLVDFKDVYGQTITDEVDIKIYNTQLTSLKNWFTVKFKGAPETLPNVPAFPTGHAKMIITPKKYRFKQVFINVEAGVTNQLTQYFFVDPAQARPRLWDFGDIPSKLYGDELMRVLRNSNLDATAWGKLDKRNRATILNLCAKMWKETIGGDRLITKVESIDLTWLDSKHRERIYANVQGTLLKAMQNEPAVYSSVNGGMHHFPPGGWTPVPHLNSFKTLKDSAGNIQFTFAQNGQGALLADIDLDDHTGLRHVADVLGHIFSGRETDPYDIHEILWFFQGLDAEYRLI
jgi:hypothetical protein